MKNVVLLGIACLLCSPLLLFAQNGTLPATRILYKMEKNKTEGLPPAGIRVFRYDNGGTINSPSNSASSYKFFIYSSIDNPSSLTDAGWRNENTDSTAGISYLGNTSTHAYGGFLLDTLSPVGVRRLNISWSCRTLVQKTTTKNYLQMQYMDLGYSFFSNVGKYSPSKIVGNQLLTEYSIEKSNENWYSSSSNVFVDKYELRWFYYSGKESPSKQSRISLDNLIVREVLNTTTGEGVLTDQSIWSLGLPQKYENFILNHNTTLSSSQNAGEVQIAPGKSLNLSTGSALSVKQLDLYSDDAYGTSEIISDGGILSVANKLTVTKTLPEKGKWYFISFPFDVKPSGIKLFDIGDKTTTEDGNHLYIKSYDGEKRAVNGTSTDNWSITTIPTDESTIVFEKNKGYLIAIDATSTTQEICFEAASVPTFSSSETINTTCYIHNNNTESPHTGWILVGNPLLNSLQLNEKPSLSGLTPFAYHYNQDSHTYEVFNMEENTLPLKPFEAFFVKATGNGAITYTTASVANSKSLSVEEKTSFSLSIMSNEDQTKTDKTIFHLTPNGRNAFFQNEDAYKLKSLDKTMPQISSIASDVEIAVNTMPLDIDTIIPLIVYCPIEGDYTFFMEGLNTLKVLTLIDLHNDTSYDLLSEEEVTFTSSGNEENRFLLQLKGNSETTKNNHETESYYAPTIDNGCLHLSNPGKRIQLHITNTQGINLYDGNITSEFWLPLKGYTGIIIISIKVENSTSIYKLISENK